MSVWGVTELWQYDGAHLAFKVLGDDGQYHVAECSLSFSHLRSADLEPFLKRRGEIGENALEQTFRQWLRESLGRTEA